MGPTPEDEAAEVMALYRMLGEAVRGGRRE